MDVRCERCQTEYELEDASVSAEGTQVQCTTCNHTFTVLPTNPTRATEPGADPSSAEWVLETADGQAHRFRNLTSLQTWIIERKVTRTDRLSRAGQGWRTLSEIGELAPFFNVLDDADRGKAAVAEVASQRGLHGEAELARIGSPRRGSSADLPTLPDPGGRSTPRGMGISGYRSSEIMAVEAPANEEELNTSVIRVRRAGGLWKLAVSFGVAVGVAYFGIQRLPRPPGNAATPVVVRTAPTVSSVPVTAGSQAEPATVAPTPSPAAIAADGSAVGDELGAGRLAGTAALAGRSTAGVDASAPSTATTTGMASAPPPGAAAAIGADAASAAAPSPAAPAPAVTESEHAAAAADRPTGATPAPEIPYGRLVADADRLLENGATVRAQRLYARALKQQPDGAEALAGLGYVSLDRQRIEPAIGYFKRALTIAPYAPAMFGLGEAYRASGARDEAIRAYERYLSTSPGGSDAAAARRQIRNLSPGPSDDLPPSNILQEPAPP